MQFVHNYRPYSVSGYAWLGDSIAKKGFRGDFIPEVMHKTWQGSHLLTLWYALALKYSHLRGIWKKVDYWVAISDFVRDRFIDAGVAERKIGTLYHSVASRAEELPSIKRKRSFAFVGRLSKEKGLRQLLAAWKLFEYDDVELHIAGAVSYTHLTLPTIA